MIKSITIATVLFRDKLALPGTNTGCHLFHFVVFRSVNRLMYMELRVFPHHPHFRTHKFKFNSGYCKICINKFSTNQFSLSSGHVKVYSCQKKKSVTNIFILNYIQVAFNCRSELCNTFILIHDPVSNEHSKWIKFSAHLEEIFIIKNHKNFKESCSCFQTKSRIYLLIPHFSFLTWQSL